MFEQKQKSENRKVQTEEHQKLKTCKWNKWNSYTPVCGGGSGNPGDCNRYLESPPRVRLPSPQGTLTMLAVLARSKPEGPFPSIKYE